MASLYEIIGQNIKRTRIEQSITASALARFLNKPVSMLEGIERGERGLSLLMLYTLADALNCKPTDLLPQRKHVTLGRGKAAALDQEMLLREHVFSDEDPEACRKWVVGVLHDSILLSLPKDR